MREIKFNAWVPDLELMLQNVTVYADGMMGMRANDFQSYIDGMPKHIQFINDGVYHSDEDRFDLLLTILPGEDWIWIDEGDFVPLQYIGLKDKNGKEIYEGDVLKIEGKDDLITFPFTGEVFWHEDAMFLVKIFNDNYPNPYWTFENFMLNETFEKIGNIYENPELVPNPKP